MKEYAAASCKIFTAGRYQLFCIFINFSFFHQEVHACSDIIYITSSNRHNNSHHRNRSRNNHRNIQPKHYLQNKLLCDIGSCIVLFPQRNRKKPARRTLLAAGREKCPCGSHFPSAITRNVPFNTPFSAIPRQPQRSCTALSACRKCAAFRGSCSAPRRG